jgi:hypothetical protein
MRVTASSKLVLFCTGSEAINREFDTSYSADKLSLTAECTK